MNSLYGLIVILSKLLIDFCVSSSNSRIDSIISPNISIRIGCSNSSGKTSIINPRLENSPVLVTIDSLL